MIEDEIWEVVINEGMFPAIFTKVEEGECSDMIAEVTEYEIENGRKIAENTAHLISCAPQLLKEVQYSLDREYNSFEPDNQSERYHRLLALVKRARNE